MIPKTLNATSCAAVLVATFAGSARAEFEPEWKAKLPVGAHLSAGLSAMTVDANGVTYVAATSSLGSYTDVLTAAYAPNGALMWSHVYDGSAQWYDQARGIALGPGGVVWVCGNTPNAFDYANVLLLGYDAATGALLHDIVSPGQSLFTSEHAGTIATDAAGNVYLGGGTTGDGADGLVMKFDPNGTLLWRRTYDGPASGPFSQDSTIEVAVDVNGDPIALHYGVMASNQPDYVVTKYTPNGSVIWHKTWGVTGGDYPSDLELDSTGDVFVTGIGIDIGNKFSTIRLRGSDGALLWQSYVGAGSRPAARSLALDSRGGVYVAGSIDPDGDQSNQNDNYFTLKHDANTGALMWTHTFGANCVGCLDTAGAVRVDSIGSVYVMGRSSTAPYSGDQLLFVLDAASGNELDRSVSSFPSPELVETGLLRFDGFENLHHAGNLYNANTGARSLLVSRYTSRSKPIYQLYASKLESGVTALFSPLHATPGALQFLIYSTTGPGSIAVPSYGVTLGITNPAVLLFAPASPAGDLATHIFVPPGLTGFTAWFQCVEFQRTTNVVQRTVQ